MTDVMKGKTSIPKSKGIEKPFCVTDKTTAQAGT